jgi:hypothetical protein
VPHQNLIAWREMVRKPFGKIHRTMPAAGATNRYRQIITIVANEAW